MDAIPVTIRGKDDFSLNIDLLVIGIRRTASHVDHFGFGLASMTVGHQRSGDIGKIGQEFSAGFHQPQPGTLHAPAHRGLPPKIRGKTVRFEPFHVDIVQPECIQFFDNVIHGIVVSRSGATASNTMKPGNLGHIIMRTFTRNLIDQKRCQFGINQVTSDQLAISFISE